MDLGTPTSITDGLGIFPKFFKDIVSIWAGTPYVFVYHGADVVVKVEIDGIVHEFTGRPKTELTMVRPFHT